MNDDEERLLTLFGTSGCHLCDDAVRVLHGMAELAAWSLDWVDIASSEALAAAYGERIPVLAWRGRELDWPFDAQDVRVLLTTDGA